MPTKDELVDALVALDETMFSRVYVDALQRRSASELAEPIPPPDATRDQFAHWLARRHLSSDVSIEEVIYLPRGAPEKEIRFLELNRLIPDGDLAIEPLEFSLDLPGANYLVLVADISGDQWARIKDGSLKLPPDWDIADNIITARRMDRP